MSAWLRIELTVPCREFEVELDWTTDEPALGLFGPSGAGKTTVLEALAGLRHGARGRIEVNGRAWLDTEHGIDLAPEARGVGYVAQELLLFPHLDVLANVRFGERRARSARTGADRPGPATPDAVAAERVLDLLELAPLARRQVGELSGGERRRVALGRALASAPALLLLDEPLVGLDLALRRRILPYLLRVREELGIPTIQVSHDPAEAMLLAREVSVLRAGRVVARGRPQELFAAGGLAGVEDARVVNLFRGKVEEVGESLAMVEVEPGLRIAVADDGTLARGQRVAFELDGADVFVALGPPPGVSAQNVVAATIAQVRLPATDTDTNTQAVITLHAGTARRLISVVVTRRACRELGLAAGAEVHLVFKAQACRVLASH